MKKKTLKILEWINSRSAFTGIVIALGAGYALFTAPFGVPDEFVHFWRICSVSEGRFLTDSNPASGGGAALPRADEEVVELLAHYHSVTLPSPRVDRKGWKRAWTKRFDPNDRLFVSFSNTADYSPIPYLPAAVILWLAARYDLSVLAAIYAARLANVVAAATLMGLTWRRLPFAREIFTLTMLLPITLSLVGSLSFDAVSLAIGFWWIALVLKVTERRPETGTPHRPIELMIAAALLGQTKFVFPCALLPLLCFFRRGTPRSRYLWMVCVASAAVALSSALLWAAASGSLESSARAGVADPLRQMTFIREHPIQFAQICAHTFRVSFLEYGRQIVGVLGWLQTRFPDWLYAGMWIGLVLSTGFQPTDKKAMSISARIFCALIAATMLLTVYLAIYAKWNATGAPIIDGIQGRYFIVMLPLLGVAFLHPLWERLQVAPTVRMSLYAFALFANVFALFTQFHAAFG